MRNVYLETLLPQGDSSVNQIRSDFGNLSKPLLNWKPNEDSWSIGQCMDHLFVTNELYKPMMTAIANGTYQSSMFEKMPWSGFWGAMVKNMVNPYSGKKSNSPKLFRPGSSDIRVSVVHDLVTQWEELRELILATDHAGHAQTIVTSPAAAFITYSLKDACIIIVTHLERHYRQAKRVMEMEEFPAVAVAAIR